MPYFAWRGIDLAGKVRSGRQCAQSEKELDALLLKRDIALLACRTTSIRFFRPINLPLKISFFRQLGTLLESGILLPDALQILGDQMGHNKFYDILQHVAKDVRNGVSLNTALQKQEELFDEFMVQAVAAGQESGNLYGALHDVADYLEVHNDFRKRVRAAALVPGYTFLFFIGITAVIFVGIVPSFASLFASMQQELPPATKTMVMMSDFLRSWYAVMVLFLFVLAGFCLKRFVMSSYGKKITDIVVLRIPYISTLVRSGSFMHFLRSTALLLEGGMQLVPALHRARQLVSNGSLQKQLTLLEYDVDAGNSLSQAMMSSVGQLWESEVIALVKVGEESGNLSIMLKKSAQLYDNKVKHLFIFFSSLFQPILMIILGLLIMLMIIAVYIPVFNISNIF